MDRNQLLALRKQMGLKPPADPAAPLNVSESVHQMNLFRWAEYAKGGVPELRWLHSIPNGGYRTKATAGKMKGEGQKPGVPDIFLDVARGGFHGLRIELKTPRIEGARGVRRTVQAGTISVDQHEWLCHYADGGYAAHVAYGWESAKDLILEYLKL